MGTNKGINIKGDLTVKGHVAIGKNATITSITTRNGIREVNNELDQLIGKVEETRITEKEKKDILAAIADLKTELNKQKLEKATITTKWESVLKNLNYVKDLVPLGTMIWSKISSLVV